MIGPISQARFDRKYRPGIPNPEFVLRHWFENSSDKTLGFVAYHQGHQSWAAAILKRRHGQYQIWRQTTASSERGAVDALFQLFGLSDRGYRERLAEQTFFDQPGNRMELLLNSHWGFDPAYDTETKARLDAPIEVFARKYFREFYPTLRAHLEAEPGQKSACSVQAFETPCIAMGVPVVGMVYLIVGSDGQPDLTIYAGREEFIAEERNAIVQHLRAVAARPGMRMLSLEGFQP